MKPMNLKKVCFGLVASLMSQNLLAEEPAKELLKPENGMYLLWSMGDLVKSRDPRAGKIDPQTRNIKVWEDEWIYELVAGLVMTSSPVERLRMTVNLEVSSYNVYPREPYGNGDGEAAQDTKFSTYIEEAKGVFTFGETPPRSFELEFGYFLNRYNSHARVFGEYLFRSMIYPSILVNNFDYPWTPLSGLRVGQAITENLHHNLYILTETDHYPYFDFSIAYEASWKLFNLFEVGGGINFQRAIPVHPSLEAPRRSANTYVKIPVQPTIYKKDSLGVIIDSIVINTESEGLLDGLGRFKEIDNSLKGSNGKLLPGIKADETFYSFQGVIPMARFAITPLAYVESRYCGNCLSLYGEASVLGWKNYEGMYENRKERIPIMGGMQLSFPGIIDIISLEVEHFGSKTVPSFFNRGHSNLPLPGAAEYKSYKDTAWVLSETERLARDDWKWILYARKQFKGIAITAQVGTDHMRRELAESGVRYDEILTNPSQWYWQLRIRIPY